MMQRLITYTIAVAVVCAGLFSTTAFAAACSNDKAVLLFPTWFHGLNCTNDVVQITDVSQVWVIVMNIVQILIIAGGYVALYFIIWAGFKYIIAAGDPQKITTAKETITNAVIGLVIVLVSVAIVQTIQAGIGGNIT